MKNRVSFFVLFFLLTIHAYSATRYMDPLDSLIQKINQEKNDTNKVKLYQELLFLANSEKPEIIVNYVAPAVALAEKLQFRVHTIKAYAGRVYWKLGKRDIALKYHLEALKLIDQKKDPDTYAQIITYIGQDYADGGNYAWALKYFLKAKNIFEKTGNLSELANMDLFISWVYTQQGNFVESSKANLDALKAFESLKDDYGVAVASSNLADDYMKLDKNSEAILYMRKSSEILQRMGDYSNLANNYLNTANAYINLNNYTEALRNITSALHFGQKIDDKIVLGNALSMQANIYFNRSSYTDAVKAYKSALEYFRRVNAFSEMAANYSLLSVCYVRLSEPGKAREALDSAAVYAGLISSPTVLSGYLFSHQLYDSLKGNWKEAYLNHYRYVSIRDSMYNDKNRKKLLQTQVQYEYDKKEAAAKAEQEKIALRNRIIRNAMSGVLAGTLIFLVVVYRQRNKIAKARKRSDELLLNILPEETAEELKAKGSADAKHFNLVTVMFTDFKGFTQIAEKLSPAELVSTIHECYKEFDSIITRHGIEKIKTIGDSYMCAGGLPVERKSHATDVVQAALEIQEYMLKHQEERRKAGKEIFEIRIGIHTGPVVAGIVGIKKFAYDIWGDTVNIASRMESSGEEGKVNISGATCELVRDKFNCTYRGKINAKNKGEIDMYFVDRVSETS